MPALREQKVTIRRGGQVSVEIEGQLFVGTVIQPTRTFGEKIEDGAEILIHDVERYEELSSSVKHEYENNLRPYGCYVAPLRLIGKISDGYESDSAAAVFVSKATNIEGENN